MAGLSWDELLHQARLSLDPGIWAAISPELYLMFWTLSLSDIYVPVKRWGAGGGA